MLRERVLAVLSKHPRSTAQIKQKLNQDTPLVNVNEVRKVLRALEVEGLVVSGKWPYHETHLEWRLKDELGGE